MRNNRIRCLKCFYLERVGKIDRQSDKMGFEASVVDPNMYYKIWIRIRPTRKTRIRLLKKYWSASYNVLEEINNCFLKKAYTAKKRRVRNSSRRIFFPLPCFYLISLKEYMYFSHFSPYFSEWIMVILYNFCFFYDKIPLWRALKSWNLKNYLWNAQIVWKKYIYHIFYSFLRQILLFLTSKLVPLCRTGTGTGMLSRLYNHHQHI